MSGIAIPTDMEARHPKKTTGPVTFLAFLAFSAALFVYFVVELRGTDDLFQIGSYNLHAADVATALGGMLVLASRPSLRRPNTFKVLAFSFGVLVAYAILRGVTESAFQAFFSFRERAVTLAFLFYVAFSGKKLVKVKQLESLFIFFVAMLFVIFCLRVIFGPTLFLRHDSVPYLAVAELEFRPVDTDTVLVMGFALIYFAGKLFRGEDSHNKLIYNLAVAAAVIVIVGSRQRTSALAAIAGLSILLLSDRGFLRRYRLVLMGMLALAGLAILIWAFGLMPVLIQMLPMEFQESFQRTETLSTRESVWSYALGWRYLNWDIVRQLFGPPAGEPLNIMYNSGYWRYSLHSQYVATIMTYGAIGALIWGALVAYGLRQAVRASRSGWPNRVGLAPSTALGWLVALLVFGVSYEWADAAGFFAAMAIAGWAPDARPRGVTRRCSVPPDAGSRDPNLTSIPAIEKVS